MLLSGNTGCATNIRREANELLSQIGAALGPMSLALHIVGWWILLSLTLGPCLTLWLFRDKQRARSACARWIATHPTTSFELMPPGLRWTNAEADFVTDDDIERELREIADGVTRS